MNLGIDGQVAVVAASSKGLGFQAARALALEGARVVISGRSQDALDRAIDQLRKESEFVEGFACDITDPESPRALVDFTRDVFGPPTIVIANAGGPPVSKALEVTDEDISRAVNANFVSSVRLIRESIEPMKTIGAGRIVCIASSSIHQAIASLPLSNAARVALWGWAKVAAKELAGTGVTLNLISPGTHATDRMKDLIKPGETPSFPMGNPEDFGHVIAFLCSRYASYINGASVVVDGGASLAL